MATKKCGKIAQNYYCDICDFSTSKESNYKIHLLTRKHESATNGNKKMPKNATAYSCDICGRCYKDRTGLWRHKQKCQNNADNTSITMKNLLQENMDMKKMMIEMMGKMGNTINNTNNNNQNNQFNINMFLNETCKDAINLSDFIERIEISHDDLENNAQLGFVNGMTKILMDNLRLLTINERPIHCTDVKRETLYIKDHNVWDKEQSVEKLENAIQEVSRKSIKSLLDWKKINPEYGNMDSEFSKKCIPMQQNSTGICNKDSFYPKIIHNLAKANSISHLKN